MISCTIVIPTHNREDLLPRAVRSALAACPADGEVLVVDDQSITPASKVLAPFMDARLKVVRNAGPSGAASSRNLGVASSNGEVIIFLDDDDEIWPDYCLRVLGAAAAADWGFACSIQRWESPQPKDVLTARRRLQHGMADRASSPRDLVAAASDGFWIKTRVFLEMGGLDTELAIDEDTDLCIRLLASDRFPWYEPDPGTVAYRGYQPFRLEGAQLTVTTPSLPGVLCYRRTYEKNAASFKSYSAMRWYLATRFVRRAIKLGHPELVDEFLGSIVPLTVRAALRGFAAVKKLGGALRMSRQ